jgi:hypothetical protein
METGSIVKIALVGGVAYLVYEMGKQYGWFGAQAVALAQAAPMPVAAAPAPTVAAPAPAAVTPTPALIPSVATVAAPTKDQLLSDMKTLSGGAASLTVQQWNYYYHQTTYGRATPVPSQTLPAGISDADLIDLDTWWKIISPSIGLSGLGWPRWPYRPSWGAGGRGWPVQ